MGRSHGVSAVGLALALAWASPAAAHGLPPGGVSLSPRTLDGRVAIVDLRRHALTVEEAGGRRTTLTVAPRATVVRDGLNVPFAEVRPGDQVKATFLAEDLDRTRPWRLELWSERSPGAP
jgi:hypothetical protein